MPLISKPNYNQIFASQAPEQDKPAVFNNYPEGWGPESRPNNGKPTIKGFNYLQQTSDLKDLWILQNGACLPYDESIEYAEGAPVLKDGVIQYKTSNGFSPAISEKPYILKYFTEGVLYPLNARVMLENGDIVKNTIDGNTVDPNVDMTGWVNTRYGRNNVRFWGALGNGVHNDSPAFQLCVNYAIASKSNFIEVTYDNNEKYRLSQTVNIPTGGFTIKGNRTPSYHLTTEGGYIFADAGVVDFFNYGAGGAYPSNQFVVDGVAGLGLFDAPRTQNFIRMNQNNNGPHRGVLFMKTSGQGFNDVFAVSPTNVDYIGAGTVVFETGCCFASNVNTASSSARVFGFSMNGIQSEQGGRINGKFDGGVSIRDCMLEGQSNPITIDSFSPSVILENNYLELITGDYLASVKGTNAGAIFDERPNYISRFEATDLFKLQGTVRLHAPYRYNLPSGRYSNYTLLGTNLSIGSKFDGAAYVGVASANEGAAGFCDPSALRAARPTAKFQKFIGSDVLDTPNGRTYSGLKSTGTSGFLTINAAGWSVGDVVTAVALVKIPDGEAVNMSIYDSASGLLGALGQNTMFRMAEGWHVLFLSRIAASTSTTTRFRFTSTKQIEIAGLGVDVTPAADFKTFNGVQRAEIQVFNPTPLSVETNIYRDVRTLTIPAIASGVSHIATGISVFGAAVGDAVVCTPNVDMQGLDWFARVSATNTVELRISNRTGASVTLGAVQWNTRVFK